MEGCDVLNGEASIRLDWNLNFSGFASQPDDPRQVESLYAELTTVVIAPLGVISSAVLWGDPVSVLYIFSMDKNILCHPYWILCY